MTSPWEELGIAPTADASAIRKAYAVRLRQTRPDEDAAGFTRLRAAYEAALQMAPRIVAAPLAEQPPPPEAKPEPPPAAPPRAEAPKFVPPPKPEPRAPMPPPRPAAGEMPEAQDSVRKIVDALNRKANIEAARLLHAACDGHLLPLRTEFHLKDRLALALLADEALPTAQLQEIAGRFGWDGGSIVLRDQANAPPTRLAARIERERAAEHARRRERSRRARNAGRIGAGSVFILLCILLVFGRGIAVQNQPHPLSPSTPVDCSGGFASMPIDALKECADRGLLEAQTTLGEAYLHGHAIHRDYAPALYWLSRAAAGNQATANRLLADMYRWGDGTATDAARARQLYLRASQLGDPAAQRGLAEMMISGEGGPVDWDQAYRLTRKTAFDRFPPAMADLGDLYERGIGTERNLPKAAAWRRAAASAGDYGAMQEYANMALNGLGTARDPAEAYRWIAIARRFSLLRAKIASEVTRSVDPALRAKIDEEVMSWTPDPPAPPEIDAH